ncbi:MAG: stage II sporulation protein R [Thermoanaerobacteraceae bacterium]
MKKLIFVFLAFVVFLSYFFVYSNNVEAAKEDISRKLIRFHVIANSDSEEDQELKLKVRDAVIFEMNKRFEKIDDIDKSEEMIKTNLEEIQKIAQEVVYKHGKDYKVKALYGWFNFPTKYYGSVALPAGKYKALRIVIGNGEGKNWWCVMFPPLCFIDITHGITDSKTKEEMAKFLTKDEINLIETDKPEMRFKIVEIFERYYNKVKMAWK